MLQRPVACLITYLLTYLKQILLNFDDIFTLIPATGVYGHAFKLLKIRCSSKLQSNFFLNELLKLNFAVNFTILVYKRAVATLLSSSATYVEFCLVVINDDVSSP